MEEKLKSIYVRGREVRLILNARVGFDVFRNKTIVMLKCKFQPYHSHVINARYFS